MACNIVHCYVHGLVVSACVCAYVRVCVRAKDTGAEYNEYIDMYVAQALSNPCKYEGHVHTCEHKFLLLCLVHLL